MRYHAMPGTGLALVFALAVAGPTASAQAVLYVDAGNPVPGSGTPSDPFNTIQAAINAAAIAGDTILVKPGTYGESIDFGTKNVTVRSDVDFSPATRDINMTGTVIDAAGISNSVVVFNGQLVLRGGPRNAVLEGFTLRNGSGNPYSATGIGPFGGGIFAFDSSPTVQDCIIENCSATSGGGIATVGDCAGMFNRLCIRNNSGGRGGGIHPAIRTQPDEAKDRSTFCNSLIVGNTCTIEGSAIYSNEAEPTLRFLTVSGNTGTHVVFVDNQAQETVTIDHCIFWGNNDPLFRFHNTCAGVVAYCDVESLQSQCFTCATCINADPLFVGTEDCDYHLTTQSPCVDVGAAGSPYADVCPGDIDAGPRPVGLALDLGADEVFCSTQALWSNYCVGHPGTLGIPTLTLGSRPALCQSTTVLASNSSGARTWCGLFLGLSPAQIPGRCGAMTCVTPFSFKVLPMGVGGLALAGSVPCDWTLCGVSIYLQLVQADPGACGGFSHTPGLQMTLGY